jgi:hypothetical protein
VRVFNRRGRRLLEHWLAGCQKGGSHCGVVSCGRGMRWAAVNGRRAKLVKKLHTQPGGVSLLPIYGSLLVATCCLCRCCMSSMVHAISQACRCGL